MHLKSLDKVEESSDREPSNIKLSEIVTFINIGHITLLKLDITLLLLVA